MIAFLVTLLIAILIGCVLPFGDADAKHEPEPLLTISQVCRRIPGARGNERITPSTVCRWILVGCPARNGQRVRLAATRAGSRWIVKLTALEEFFASLGATDPATSTPAKQHVPRTEAQRRTASEAAAKELERRGA